MTHEIFIPPLPTHWAGGDLAKTSLELGLWGHEELSQRKVRHFPRTRAGAKALVAWMKSQAPVGARLGLVLEATGTFADELAAWVHDFEPDLYISIVNPAQVHAYIRSLGLRNKTDNLDTRALAGYGTERKPRAWEKPSPALVELKDLIRTRSDLVEARVAMNLRLKDHPRAAKGATKALEQIIQALDDGVKALESSIQAHLKRHEDLCIQVKRFMSIQGVGFITAVTVAAELGDLRRFVRSRQLTAFAGVSPRKKESGTSVRGRTRMCKQGSARVRSVLYMAAMSAARFNPDLAATYAGLIEKGHHWRSAMGAVMRKLLILMRAVLKADQDWVPKAQAH